MSRSDPNNLFKLLQILHTIEKHSMQTTLVRDNQKPTPSFEINITLPFDINENIPKDGVLVHDIINLVQLVQESTLLKYIKSGDHYNVTTYLYDDNPLNPGFKSTDVSRYDVMSRHTRVIPDKNIYRLTLVLPIDIITRTDFTNFSPLNKLTNAKNIAKYFTKAMSTQNEFNASGITLTSLTIATIITALEGTHLEGYCTHLSLELVSCLADHGPVAFKLNEAFREKIPTVSNISEYNGIKIVEVLSVLDSDVLIQNTFNPLDIKLNGMLLSGEDTPFVAKCFNIYNDAEKDPDISCIPQNQFTLKSGYNNSASVAKLPLVISNDRNKIKEYFLQDTERTRDRLISRWQFISKKLNLTDPNKKVLAFLMLNSFLGLTINKKSITFNQYNVLPTNEPFLFFMFNKIYKMDVKTAFGVEIPINYFKAFTNIDMTIEVLLGYSLEGRMPKLRPQNEPQIDRILQGTLGNLPEVFYPYQIKSPSATYPKKFSFFQGSKPTLVIVNDSGLTKGVSRKKINQFINENGSKWYDGGVTRTINILTPSSRFEAIKLKRYLKYRPYSFFMSEEIPNLKKIPTNKAPTHPKTDDPIIKAYTAGSIQAKHLSHVANKVSSLAVSSNLFIVWKSSRKTLDYFQERDKYMDQSLKNSIAFWNSLLTPGIFQNIYLVSAPNFKKIKKIDPSILTLDEFIFDPKSTGIIQDQLKATSVLQRHSQKEYVIRSFWEKYINTFYRTRISINDLKSTISQKPFDVYQHSGRLFNNLAVVLENQFLNSIQPKVRHFITKILSSSDIIRQNKYHTVMRLRSKFITIPPKEAKEYQLVHALITPDIESNILELKDTALMSSYGELLSSIELQLSTKFTLEREISNYDFMIRTNMVNHEIGVNLLTRSHIIKMDAKLSPGFKKLKNTKENGGDT